jgi:hypothetical protein
VKKKNQNGQNYVLFFVISFIIFPWNINTLLPHFVKNFNVILYLYNSFSEEKSCSRLFQLSFKWEGRQTDAYCLATNIKGLEGKATCHLHE